MLSVQKSSSHRGKCTPNILPCRINHNGPVNTSKRYWNPVTRDNKTISYFRGRKLHARNVQVPKGYKGVVLSKTERILPRDNRDEGDEDDEAMEVKREVETKIVEEQSTFEEIVVWGHESIKDEGDPYVRGVEEWVGFAEAIHAYDTDGCEGAERKD